jgi:hypothetical protein
VKDQLESRKIKRKKKLNIAKDKEIIFYLKNEEQMETKKVKWIE